MDQRVTNAGIAGHVEHAARRDQYVHYSHEMTDDTAEASARFLIRGVPLVYGALLGGLIGDFYLGVCLGIALMVALDTRMGKQSLFRPLLRPLLNAFARKD